MLWRNWLLAFCSSGLIAFSIAAAADQPQPSPGAYKAIGGGGIVRCGHFVAELDKGPAADQILGTSVISWVAGYLTAYNETLANVPDVAGNLSAGLTELDVMNWIGNFCAAHPNEFMAVAARELVMHLFRDAPSRLRTQ